MKRHAALAILFLTAVLAWAGPVRISSWNFQQDVKRLNEMKISVHTVNKAAGSIIAYVRDDSEYQTLLDHGFDAVRLPDEAAEYARRLAGIKSLDPPQNEYYTIDQYYQFMNQTAAQYPSICALVQVGTSVQNRPLYFLRISDNVNVEEAEPEFKFISSIHGNEVVGYDMCIRLIQQLTSEYGTNPRITNLVNDTEIWICPMMNPDGYVLGQRYNANGIDLNRNFLMPTGVQHPDGNDWQPENVAIMDFGLNHSFILSANFHGGALVMNYPWDYTYVLTPDDDVCQAAALTYSIHNGPMYNSAEFENGITNGAEWYVITGSMQDWNYGYTDCLDITAEIGYSMWPPASQLPTYWSQNQESMLSYMEFVHRGVNGIVHDLAGNPLAATITVQGNAKVNHTDPDVGDYHRLLLAGTYTITAAAPGYLPQTAQVTVPDLGSATCNFALEAAQAVTLHGQLRTLDGLGIPAAQVTLSTDPAATTTTDQNGSFIFTGVLEGNYTLTVGSGDGSTSFDFLLTAADNYQVFLVTDPEILLDEPFDNISNWTATSPWGITNYMGDSVLTDSPSGNYGNNINRSVRLTSPISLQNIIDPVLSFRTRYGLESGYDNVYLEASTTGSNWVQLASYTGEQSTWQQCSYPLDAYAGQNLYLRFRIQTDYSVNMDGIYIDDLSVSGIGADDVFYGDANGDRRVSRADAQAILDYGIGLDPLPELDPLPWEAGRLTACDADFDQQVTEMDAYLALRYILDPAFRFEAQSGEEEVFAPGSMTHECYGQAHSFMVPQPADLKSLRLQFLPLAAVTILDWGTSAGLHSVNYAQNQIAWIRENDEFNGVIVWLQSTVNPIHLDYWINGHYATAEIAGGSASDDDSMVPVFSLAQNHPNPFNPSTSILFSVSDATQPTSLRIYNAKGQLVRTLHDGLMDVGEHTLVWDGKDESSSGVSSGIYLYRLVNGSRSQTRRMMLMK
jgi:hypothetical protein